MTRDELIEVMAKGMWDKHCQIYPKDSFLRGDWQADEDIGFLYTRFSRYAEATLAAIEAAGVMLVPVEAQVGMFKAMTQSWGDGPEQQRGIGRWALGSFREDYQAMIAASPYAPQKDTTHESD